MGEFTPVREAVDAWTAAWSVRDPDALMSLWDTDDAEASYLAAENDAPLTSADAVRSYMRMMCDVFSDIRHRAEGVITREITADLGMAFYSVAWMVRDRRGPIGGTCRVTSVWRRHGEVWRCCHYAEAPLAPLLELQRYYEAIADDGLDAIPVRG